MKEMMTTMMAQNMQLQQVMLQQMIAASPRESHATETMTPLSLSRHSIRPQEFDQISGLREMTPFATLANKTAIQQVEPALLPSQYKQVPRGIATPVRSTERLRELPRWPRASLKPDGFLNQIITNGPSVKTYPFPGPYRIRKFRHVAYVAWACCILMSQLKNSVQKRLSAMERLDMLINQAIEELHRKHYLNAEGSVRPAIEDAVNESAFDFQIKNPGVFQRLSKNSQATLTELSSIVETVVYNVIRIKTSVGLLSDTREGILWQMSQVGVLLPLNYLWQDEKEHVRFTERGAVAEVTNQTSIMLLLGLFISRGLVSTLLLNPTEYGLINGAPSDLASSNLKVLASIFMKLVRDVTGLHLKKKALPLASEISSQLLSDDEMKFIYKKLDDTFIWCKANLSRWAEAYVESVNRS